jgi:hypothetical protein
MKPKALALTLLIGTLMFPALAFARQNPGNQRQRGPGLGEGGAQVLTNVRFLTRYVNLSTAQVTPDPGLPADAADGCAVRSDLPRDPLSAAPDRCQREHLGPAAVESDYLALIVNQAKVQAALAAFETSAEGVLTSDQLTKFQALVQAAGSGTESDALPGCPAADSSSDS